MVLNPNAKQGPFLSSAQVYRAAEDYGIPLKAPNGNPLFVPPDLTEEELPSFLKTAMQEYIAEFGQPGQ